MTKRGRPRKPVVDPAQLVVLTIPEVLIYLRELGRGISRPKVMDAILGARLPAQIDGLRNDRFGRPLLLVLRVDLETWLAGTIRPLVIEPMGKARRIS